MKRFAIALLLLSAAIAAQTQPNQEFRGVWVATVANLDWPTSRTASVASQQADLIAHFDQLKAAGVNAVLFQVRTEADALYASSIEPWSYYLTGVEGQAPSPFWDPLEFAIREAHKRGMELHAWLNPYRADRVPGLFTRAANHVTVTNPEWIITATSSTSSIRIMNPGIPAVRERITAVVMDIVRRYDVDGIHFDDYFYPYPPNDMGFNTARWDLDKATFEQYGAGFSIRSDWRRNNINTMVKAVHDSIKSVKPHVKFGISPFGIWKNGTPSGITGMNAFDVIYADALQWLSVKSVDYITPQL
ncbi:MAG: family 10 glycosylhydrolase, partial [Synechococcus sp.]|nr:family 10 glycosylhydrolase [Synechococcus sp.]